MEQLIKGLTFAELKEAYKLRKTIFKGTNFVLYTEELLDTVECKRYLELMQKKVAHLKRGI